MRFDEDVSKSILATAKGDADSRLQTMTAVILSYAFERFRQVEKEKPKPTSYTMNRRATRIYHLRQELRTFKQPLAELRNILRRKLTTLHTDRVALEMGKRES